MPRLSPQAEQDAIIRNARWSSLEQEFIELSITGKEVHWPSLAKKYGFEPQTVRNRASSKKWYAKVGPAKAEREALLETKLTERTAAALNQLNEDFVTNEVAIRKRHAAIARGLQVRAVQRLKDMPLEQFTAKDALMMLKLGLEEERFAMGLQQVFEGAKDVSNHAEFAPLVEQMGGHRKTQEVGMLLLKALRDSDIEEAAEDLLKANANGPVDAVIKSVTTHAPVKVQTPPPEPATPPAGPPPAPPKTTIPAAVPVAKKMPGSVIFKKKVTAP